MEIGSKTKEKREQKHWSQDEPAEILNISRQSISKWELNKVYPSIDMLIKMSDLFDISLDELIKGDKQFKKTIIETYQDPVSYHHQKRGMNGWEFLAGHWWLFFPIAGMIWWMLRSFI
ncbi:helix-turn-helix domain-containing protein [Staphylococcus saprophyticus]|nr:MULTISPECIES: helix-turn-helix domain-containing protein [Staphylococcus]CRV27629.1 XRE family transcriptional regulator [Streptococcus equi subsp. equi]MBN6754450.1 helix-turn-helix domain-containing protein [Staphylococcus saprophyticus]MBN6764431.1 helix-turn-helix domain-containing protein [Staphylococcus saprophyticus]MBN6769234.1 helix-turn-helix domain-containing protein [Staphylococcus saprophyticus]MBN6780921.1 helix-turn-helix domain-containing protein [Staphylococcus saprophyticu